MLEWLARNTESEIRNTEKQEICRPQFDALN